MRWKQWLLMFVSTILLLFAGNAIAQTDININNTNLVRLGGDVTVQEKQVVENAIAIGGDVTVQSSARVTKTAIAVGGNLTLKKGSRVEGDAYVIGGKVVQEEGATIGGAKQTFNDQNSGAGMHSDRGMPMYFFQAMTRIFSAIVAAVLGIVLLRVAPSFLPNLAVTLQRHPGQSALWGLGAIVALIVVNIFLAITLIGIPLIPLISLVVSLTALVGSLGISLWMGQQVLKDKRYDQLQQFLVGLLVITLLALMPGIGGVVVFLVSLFGLGALLAWKLVFAR